MRYSLIMPYLDRALLLDNTLRRFVELYDGRNDWEIVIIRDSKCTAPDRLACVVGAYRRAWRTISVLELDGADCHGPSKSLNLGVSKAQGQFIILTSPEIRHEVDILAGLDGALADNPGQYVVCACQGLDKKGKPAQWFQHSVHRPARYHFCSAISRENYLRLGGFDESFATGYCFDDDDWRDTVLAAGVPVTQQDDLLTSHQWHEKHPFAGPKSLWERNKSLYEAKWGPYRAWPAPKIGG